MSQRTMLVLEKEKEKKKWPSLKPSGSVEYFFREHSLDIGGRRGARRNLNTEGDSGPRVPIYHRLRGTRYLALTWIAPCFVLTNIPSSPSLGYSGVYRLWMPCPQISGRNVKVKPIPGDTKDGK